MPRCLLGATRLLGEQTGPPQPSAASRQLSPGDDSRECRLRESLFLCDRSHSLNGCPTPSTPPGEILPPPLVSGGGPAGRGQGREVGLSGGSAPGNRARVLLTSTRADTEGRSPGSLEEGPHFGPPASRT